MPAPQPCLVRLAAVALTVAALLVAGGWTSIGSVAQRIPPGVELPAGAGVTHPGVAEPDPRLTPGAVFAGATVAEICQAGYARRHRDVPTSLKRQVYRAYHVAYAPGRFTVDHLVPLELGGANLGRDPPSGRVVATANLWPQPSRGASAAGSKDRLENYLHGQVCAGRIGLRTAQVAIARDWYGAWLAAGRP